MELHTEGFFYMYNVRESKKNEVTPFRNNLVLNNYYTIKFLIVKSFRKKN